MRGVLWLRSFLRYLRMSGSGRGPVAVRGASLRPFPSTSGRAGSGGCADAGGLGVDAADACGFYYAADAQHHRCLAHGDAVLLRHRRNVAVGAGDDAMQALVDLVFFPEVELEVLHPLEVGDDDAAGVGEDVRDEDDTVARQDRVGFRRRGAIGALDDVARAHVAGVAIVNLTLERGGDKEIDREG